MRLPSGFSDNAPLFLYSLFLFKYKIGVNEVFAKKEHKSEANFTELASSYGYTAEEYTVVTDDGYILSLFRIPKGKNCQGPLRRPSVLLMHGFPQSSDSWLDAGPPSLAFLISDACFDLWIANVRGNYYGRRHVRLNPDVDPNFWKFSSHEMAILDLPAIIDVILKTTNSHDIMYIGYSQGGRLLFILCSETEYCNKIKFSIGVAPAARIKYTKSLLVKYGSQFYAFLEPYLSTPIAMEAFPRDGLIQRLAFYVSRVPFIGETFTKFALSLIDSDDPGSFTSETLRAVFEHCPAGTSARNIAFFGQGGLSGRFQKYDYGPRKNLELYNNVHPPLYNLSRANMPILLMYGNNDFVVDPRDTKWLAKQLPNVIETYEVPKSTWNHVDVCYSQFVDQMIFYKIKEYLEEYTDV